MAAPSLRSRLARLETASPVTAEVSLDELDALARCLDLANIDLDKPGSPAMNKIKSELKALLARLMEGQPGCPIP